VFVSARQMTPLLRAAYAAKPATGAPVAAALRSLEGWSYDMRADEVAPSVFAVFYRRLFFEIFADELGDELAKAYRSRGNLSAIMLTTVMAGGHESWFDRASTPAVETRDVILRAAFEKGVADLGALLGPDPKGWTWGRIHTIELQHPLGRASKALAPLFNRGPFPLSGTTSTVNKGEFGEDSFEVKSGPSMRQLTDLGDLAHGLAVIPSGQSGLPASRHYDDLLPLWLEGSYHPLLMDRGDIDKAAEARLTLRPQ